MCKQDPALMTKRYINTKNGCPNSLKPKKQVQRMLPMINM